MWGEMGTVSRSADPRRHFRWLGALASLTIVTFIAATSCAASTNHIAAPRLTPNAPPQVSAIPRNGAAVVRWTVPANHGSKITRFSITTYLGKVVAARKVVGPITQVNVTRLTNGRRYTFRVAAFNAHGYGPAGAGAATIGAPAAPTGVNARSVSAGMHVSWHAPLITNGSRIAKPGFAESYVDAGVAETWGSPSGTRRRRRHRGRTTSATGRREDSE